MSNDAQNKWRYWPCKDGSYDSKNDYIQIADGDRHVAQIRIASVTEDDMRLIASAPELLEALQDIYADLIQDAIPSPESDWWNKASAAIAKATGEPQ